MRRGIALITVVTTLFLLLAVMGSFLYLLTRAYRINLRYPENIKALALAEAGVDYAIWEIDYGGEDFTPGEGWSGANPKTKTIIGFSDADDNVYGNINIEVYDPGTDEVVVLSEGTVASNTGPLVRRRVRVLLEKHQIFNYAILAANSIDIGGTSNKVDSYDSSAGPYGGTNVGDNGDIVTNGTEDPAISLRGGATVDGDVTTGPGGVIQTEGGGSYSGYPDDDAEVFMPSVVVPSSLTNLASDGPLSLAGHQSLVINSGEYKYDSLVMGAHAVLTLDGNVSLYLTDNPALTTSGQSQIVVRNGQTNVYFNGDLTIGGEGISNESQTPSDLFFYGTDNVANVSLAGGGATYGCFYAPNANYFYISGNCNVYGSVVGKNVSLTGTASIHYDEQLMINSPTIGYDPFLWQEK